MPNLEEHCKITLKKLGVEGRDIHKYIDKPVKLFGSSHRNVRHDLTAVKYIGKVFEKKYGKQLAEDIALSHLFADKVTKKWNLVLCSRHKICSEHMCDSCSNNPVILRFETYKHVTKKQLLAFPAVKKLIKQKL